VFVRLFVFFFFFFFFFFFSPSPCPSPCPSPSSPSSILPSFSYQFRMLVLLLLIAAASAQFALNGTYIASRGSCGFSYAQYINFPDIIVSASYLGGVYNFSVAASFQPSAPLAYGTMDASSMVISIPEQPMPDPSWKAWCSGIPRMTNIQFSIALLCSLSVQGGASTFCDVEYVCASGACHQSMGMPHQMGKK
jgi:hypothetical protein